MTCKDVNGMLDRLMDGELTEDERRELEAHGRECPECAAEIRATLEMKALFEETLPEADVPLAAQAKWRGAIREAAKRDRQRKFTRWISSAAAALVVLVGVGVAMRGSLAPKNDAAMPAPAVQEAAEANHSDAPEIQAEYAAEAASDAAPVVETDGAGALMGLYSEDAMVGGLGAPQVMSTNEPLPMMAAEESRAVEDAEVNEAAEAYGAGEAYEAAEASDDADAYADAEAFEEADEAPEAFEDSAMESKSMCAALAQRSPACEYAIQSASVDIACTMISELAGEFEGTADVQSVEGGGANIYVELDAASAGEFLEAVAKIDDSQNPNQPPRVSGEGPVLVLLVVNPAQ